jgi:hypothetical protein
VRAVLSEFGALFDGLADAYDGKLRAKTRDAAQGARVPRGDPGRDP